MRAVPSRKRSGRKASGSGQRSGRRWTSQAGEPVAVDAVLSRGTGDLPPAAALSERIAALCLDDAGVPRAESVTAIAEKFFTGDGDRESAFELVMDRIAEGGGRGRRGLCCEHAGRRHPLPPWREKGRLDLRLPLGLQPQARSPGARARGSVERGRLARPVSARDARAPQALAMNIGQGCGVMRGACGGRICTQA